MKDFEAEELRVLESATTLDELADAATSFLKRMKQEYEVVVQICGPMSTGGCGTFEGNMARFNRSVEVAIENGAAVFNQVLFQEAMIRICNWKEGDPYPEQLLTVFYARVLSSGYIDKGLFLSGWETSTGSRWERNFLTSLGIPTEEYPPEWLL